MYHQRTATPPRSKNEASIAQLVSLSASSSLASLPMHHNHGHSHQRPRTSTVTSKSGMQAVPLSPMSSHSSYKRPRVSSKSGTLGSRLRSRFHSLRSSNSNGSTHDVTKAWEVNMDAPMMLEQALFSDESLSAPPSRWMSKKTTAHGTFRRFRNGGSNKAVMSYPPALGETSIYDELLENEDFVLITANHEALGPASTVDVNGMRLAGAMETSTRGVTPRLNNPLARFSSSRARANSQQPAGYGRRGTAGNGSSCDSLVSVMTPPLSVSSSASTTSTVSLVPTAPLPPVPAQRTVQPQPQPQVQLTQQAPKQPQAARPRSITTVSARAITLSSGARIPASTSVAGGKFRTPRKISECSFSSTEEQRSAIGLQGMEAGQSMTPSAANQARERRRRSSGVRGRRQRAFLGPSVQSGLNPDDAGRAHGQHTLNGSELSSHTVDFPNGHRSRRSFDFQVDEAGYEAYWLRREPTLHNEAIEEDEDRARAATFPVTRGTQFMFEMGMQSGTTFVDKRDVRRARRSSGVDQAAVDEIRGAAFPFLAHDYQGGPQTDDLPPMDPRSPFISDVASIRLSPRGTVATLCPEPIGSSCDSAIGGVAMMSTLSAGVPENIDFDGSTLTQQNDWLLMSTAAAEDGSSPNSSGGRSRGRRNNRKRTVLPLELFKNAIDGPEKLPPAKPAAVVLKSRSTETLLPLPWCSEDGSRAVISGIGGEAAAVAPCAVVIATAGSGLSCPTMRDVADAADSTALRVAPLPPYAKPGYLPSVPPSMRIVVSTQNVTRLRLACTGDSGSWLAARVPHFSTLLVAGIEQAAALQDLALINVGLVAVLPALLRCKDLRRLDMSHNWINSAPGWLSRLQELRHIVLAGNPLATVSADLVEMRSRLETLCLGTGKWSLVSRSESAMVAHSRAEQQRRVCQRIEATANRRMAAFLSSTRLALTPRQHEASLDKAKLLLQAYARILHSQLHEARPWGHSVPLPYLPLPQHLRPVAVPAAGI